MTKPINTKSIEKATGKLWSEWIEELDGVGARNMTHTEIAHKLSSKLEGTIRSHGWWAQGITVAYEQYIGKRQPGQLTDGLFELAISKTIAKSRRSIFPQIANWFESQTSLNGFDFKKPRSSETLKRSNWRCDFADGNKSAEYSRTPV